MRGIFSKRLLVSLSVCHNTNLCGSLTILSEYQSTKFNPPFLLSTGVIPKSTNPKHIIENFNLWDFEIAEDDMRKMDALNIDKHYCWDPSTVV